MIRIGLGAIRRNRSEEGDEDGRGRVPLCRGGVAWGLV